MTALYNLAGQYAALADKLDRLELDDQTIADTIESSGLVDDIQTKAQGVLMVAAESTKYVTLIEIEIQRLKDLKATRERVAAGLREYLKTCMESAGIEKIECPLWKVSIQKNPPSVDVFDPLSIPAAYMTDPKPVPPAPDKALIKQAIKEGFEVPGARLTQSTRLAIK
jgi:hypothetical protein